MAPHGDRGHRTIANAGHAFVNEKRLCLEPNSSDSLFFLLYTIESAV